MQSLSSFLMASMPGKISCITLNMPEYNSLLLSLYDGDILFANGGSTKRNSANESKEIRDESGLGSGAGITPEDQARFDNQSVRPESEYDSLTNDDGASGPGSDRTGDKMPGEDGITSLTDGIARLIDDAEEKNSEKRGRKK